ncbi:TPA: hypothetical protein N0F65_007748 [Lagenidium giganteum]|uniref:Cell division cycle protein 123 n=1 Tax=Lagenidium giganteum TaxID=4803 RepID=A0AAV2Z4Y6_9STRA|nr:TPA: hypothetical protein N0F65_007748 [Lagenidium giganteum]
MTPQDEAPPTPAYTRAHVDNCAFGSWYLKLQHVSIKGAIVPLPASFVSLLLADVKKQVEAALERFGGRAFIKLNWSCPRDATWMLGSLKVESFDDAFLLLKSSDFIVHDITQAYAGCSDINGSDEGSEAHLVVKKWCNFYDSMHFRCFVVNHRLVGVSQRHCHEYYEFLFEQQDHLCQLIYDFFHANFRGKAVFPDPEYIFDVYVDKQHRVYLVDINVFGDVTDPLLFTWEELLELQAEARRKDADDDDEQVVDFRIVESQQALQANPLSCYRAPVDFVDHLANGAGFDGFLDQVRRDNAAADSDSDSDDDTEPAQDDDDDDVVWGSDNDD